MKKIIVSFLCLGMLIAFFACSPIEPLNNDNTTTYQSSTENQNSTENTIGKIVEFGTFEQDGNLSNGSEPLRWIIIAEDDGNYLLLSEKVIMPLKYSDASTGNNWENSYVYNWLNNDFLNSAFSTNQRQHLQHKSIVSEYWGAQDEYYNTEYIFILSINEINYFNSITENGGIYLCHPTVYAEQIDNSFIHNSDTYLSEYNGMAEFWTRPMGTHASIDGPKGGFELKGYGDSVYGIRPALWVKKDITLENKTEVYESNNPGTEKNDKTNIPSETGTKTNNNSNINTETNNKGTVTFDQKIKKIKKVFSTTENELGQYTEKFFGTSATAYYKNGSLRKLNEYPEYNPVTDGYGNGEKEKFFYYENGELYFILLIDANTDAEDRLYYYDGELIRWIDSNSTIHDNSAKLKEMNKWYGYAMEKYNDVG